jgi:hypothetical protein
VPGIGNSISNPTFFVPLHAFHSPYVVKKTPDFTHNQEGSGIEDSQENESKVIADEVKNENNEKNEIGNGKKEKIWIPRFFKLLPIPVLNLKQLN